MTLQRLIIDYREQVLVVRALYDHATPDAPVLTRRPAPGVAALVRAGLERALEALDSEASDVADLGTSGFTTREDTILCSGRDLSAHSVHKKLTRKGTRVEGAA